MLLSAVGGLLPALDEAFPTSLVTVLRSFLETHAAATNVEVYLSDYDLLTLRLLDESGERSPNSLPVDSTEPGRAFVAQVPTIESVDDAIRVFVPMSVRTERLGVLAVTLTGMPDADTLEGLLGVAVSLSYVLMTAANYTDVIERARRQQPLSLPAEIQWAMLPTRAYGCPEFSVAGQLVPAYEVGGDLFDYAVEPNRLIVTVTDAMGHGLDASMLGSLAIGALRNSRRTGLALTDQVRSADRVLYGRYGGDQFVTAVVVSIDLRSGAADVVNAGHPGIFLLRAGTVTCLDLDAQLPMGMFEATDYREQQVRLEAGDRVVLVSDGVLEARAEDGTEYGEERLEGAVLATAALSAEEAVRQLVAQLRDYQGSDQRDDATMVCLDWRGARG